tara:strand:- start:353 stop:481 length:129 start_codon:yes stop_codon:yes gene_type:complete
MDIIDIINNDVNKTINMSIITNGSDIKKKRNLIKSSIGSDLG